MKLFFKSEEFEMQRVLIGALLVAIASITYTIYSTNYKDTTLKNGRFSWAVIDKISGQARSGIFFEIHYYNDKGKKILIDNYDPRGKDCFSYKAEGDTVYIKYGLVDNYVIDIVHCYWNDVLQKQLKDTQN